MRATTPKQFAWIVAAAIAFQGLAGSVSFAESEASEASDADLGQSALPPALQDQSRRVILTSNPEACPTDPQAPKPLHPATAPSLEIERASKDGLSFHLCDISGVTGENRCEKLGRAENLLGYTEVDFGRARKQMDKDNRRTAELEIAGAALSGALTAVAAAFLFKPYALERPPNLFTLNWDGRFFDKNAETLPFRRAWTPSDEALRPLDKINLQRRLSWAGLWSLPGIGLGSALGWELSPSKIAPKGPFDAAMDAKSRLSSVQDIVVCVDDLGSIASALGLALGWIDRHASASENGR